MIKMNDKTYRIMWQGKEHRIPITDLRVYAAFCKIGTFNWNVPENGLYEIKLSGGGMYNGNPNHKIVKRKGELIVKQVELSKNMKVSVQIGNFGHTRWSYKGNVHEELPTEDTVLSYESDNVIAKGASGDVTQNGESNNKGSSQQGYCFIRRVG